MTSTANALMNNYQSHIKVTLQLQDGTPCEVVKYRIVEKLSEPFMAEIDFAVPDMLVGDDGSISSTGKQNWIIADLLDTQATLTIWVKNKPVRYLSGIITQCAEGKRGKRRQSYSLVIEAPLKRLELTSDWRIHQQQDVKDITEALLRRNKIPHYDYQLNGSYEKREFCVQAGESDALFLHRMFSESGIYYYYEHDAQQSKMIIKDKSEQSQKLLDIVYNPDAGGSRPHSALWSFEYHEKLVSAKHTVRDYTFKHPRYNLEQKYDGLYLDNQAKHYEQYAYPGRYKKDASGRPFTKVKQESAQRNHRVATMQGDEPSVYPGIRIEVSGHHQDAHNAQWLVTEVIHEGRQPQSVQEDNVAARLDNSDQADFVKQPTQENSHYENTIKAVPWYQPWRAAIEPKPKVDGPHIAMVVGPAGEEIYCDEHGRVKLHLYYDRYSKQDENSSCWVRVSQNWAGGNWGHMAVPRIGQEVIVEYLDGDPDQPIITGRTYHATNRPPMQLPEHKTRMVLKSKTHKGDGFNELTFEDEMDKEFIYMHAQKDMEVHVKNSRQKRVEFDDTATIGNNSYLAVAKDRIEKVDGNQNVTVTSNLVEKIDGERGLTVGGGFKTKTGGDLMFKADGEIVLDASKITLVSGGAAVVISGGKVDVAPMLNVGSASPGAAALPAIPAVLEAAAGEGSPFVSHCPLKDE